jgi:hypothetical protein
MTTYEATTGSIVHVELLSRDHPGTRGLLESTFGWEFDRDEEQEYLMWWAPNPPGGGLVDETTWPDAPASTVLYVRVDDVDATRTAIVDAGGELVVDEVEVPGMGVFVVFRDPGGVVNAAREDRFEGEPPEGGWPAFTDDPSPGSVAHFELYSEDPGATEAFYARVFDWTFESVDEGGYTMASPPTPPFGGLMAATEEWPAGTLLYLQVPGAEAACADVEAAGGRVLRNPFVVDEWGTMAVFETPGGTTLAVWESSGGDEVEGAAADSRRAT